MSGQELEQRGPQQFPNLITGEVIDRDDLPAVARCLDEMVEYRRKFNEAIRFVEDILLQASREYGTKTLNLEGLKAVVSGGSKIEWDIEKLQELLEAGLPYDRFNELVTVEHTYKVNANVAKSISGSNEKYAEIVAAARQDLPAPERVRIVAG